MNAFAVRCATIIDSIHGWLHDGLFIPHTYPDPQALSGWDDVGFILNHRRVMVWWVHPPLLWNLDIKNVLTEVHCLG